MLEKWLLHSGFLLRNRLPTPQSRKIPCKIPCLQGICQETGAISTAPPATHSCVRSGCPRNARMGRKSRLFAHTISSPDSGFAGLEVEIAESLRPCPQIFPFCGDYRRRLVRSRLPPEGNERRMVRAPEKLTKASPSSRRCGL